VGRRDSLCTQPARIKNSEPVLLINIIPSICPRSKSTEVSLSVVNPALTVSGLAEPILEMSCPYLELIAGYEALREISDNVLVRPESSKTVVVEPRQLRRVEAASVHFAPNEDFRKIGVFGDNNVERHVLLVNGPIGLSPYNECIFPYFYADKYE
jgi:hypothetical protein